MKNREMLASIETLAQRYQWRFLKGASEVCGMHRGVAFHVTFWDGVATQFPSGSVSGIGTSSS